MSLFLLSAVPLQVLLFRYVVGAVHLVPLAKPHAAREVEAATTFERYWRVDSFAVYV